MVEETIIAKYQFSPEELRELGEKLAHLVEQLSNKEAEKKEIVSAYTADINSLKARIQQVSQKIGNGFEMRETVCRVEFDYAAGVKRYWDIETGELKLERKLTPEERQLDMFQGDGLPGEEPPVPVDRLSKERDRNVQPAIREEIPEEKKELF